MSKFEFPYIWIERKYRTNFDKSSAAGIRVTYDKHLDRELVEQTKALVQYLRKEYYFPIRVNIALTDHRRYHSDRDGHIYYGIFYHNDFVPLSSMPYPQIAVAAQLWKHMSIDDVHFTLLHELTHYFQWFFTEEEQRSDRSLELEANRWARYILYCFQHQGSAVGENPTE